MANRLSSETSPYLLQHAHNPVDWYPWTEEALKAARDEDKPILVSIGYSACHWCHVMERESFENEETAALMNRLFINIKIDREERPDLDHIYMDAVQTMTGSGGWPLNVFLTPDAQPFFGGTYFPPRRAFNRSSWTEVLTAVATAFREKREEITAQAKNLAGHMAQSNSFVFGNAGDQETLFAKEKMATLFQNLLKAADRQWGGFSRAPKFPQTFSIQFLLRYYFVTKDNESLQQACLSLDKMIEGGIYDQAGGGFARYATDNEWLVPHFEKMLYDNALIVSVLAEAFQLTKEKKYQKIIEETITFLQREMMHPGKGFYAALDADSEGVEGKFYVWSWEEVQSLLAADAKIFCEFFDITEGGNWEGTNILRTKIPAAAFAKEKNILPDVLEKIIENGKSILLEARSKRVRPGLDDKIILGWNAMMNSACSKAFAATGNESYRQLAIDNMRFLLHHLSGDEGAQFFHSWKNDEAKNFAFLDDYACLVRALMDLQEITGDVSWLAKAREITDFVLINFSDEETGFFYFSDVKQTDLILRKKEIYDGATPSGNATMAYNIYHLSKLLNIPDFAGRTQKMVISLSDTIIKYPTSFGAWAALLLEMSYGTEEIVVVGKQSSFLAKHVLAEYLPHKVFMASEQGIENLPMLAEKPLSSKPLIYVCREYSCLKPVQDVEQLLLLLK